MSRLNLSGARYSIIILHLLALLATWWPFPTFLPRDDDRIFPVRGAPGAPAPAKLQALCSGAPRRSHKPGRRSSQANRLSFAPSLHKVAPSNRKILNAQACGKGLEPIAEDSMQDLDKTVQGKTRARREPGGAPDVLSVVLAESGAFRRKAFPAGREILRPS